MKRFDDLITSSSDVEFHEVRYEQNKIVIEAANEEIPASPVAPTAPPPTAPTAPPPTAPPAMPQIDEQPTSVASWEGLPQGGAYDYSQGTRYIAPDGSVWVQNAAQGFDKLD